jgi:uncharacterized protein
MDSADRTETAPPTPSAASAIADPGPLGLAAFALTTFMLSVFNAGLIHTVGLSAVVLPVALFYGGIAQLLAGMWEFKKNNTFGALAFTSYGAFWLSFAALVKFVAPGLPPAGAHTAIGLFLLAWTIFTVLMTIAVVKVNGALLAVFVVLTATFICLTIGELQEQANISKIGGWLGLATAALAWYTALAGLMASTYKKSVLPVFPAK